MSADLVAFLKARLDDDELWAIEASRRYGEQEPGGGVHWQWEDSETDEVVTPDPGREEVVGGDRFRVALRSRETWPTHSVGELPQFAIPTAEEVPSAVGGHIARHDPARVLAEVEAKRKLLRVYEGAVAFYSEPGNRAVLAGEVTGLRTAVRLLAHAHVDHPDYREDWLPVS